VSSNRIVISSQRSYQIAASPEQVWRRIDRVADYTRWWPWLRRFEAVGLVAGDEWRCTIRPPLPYLLRMVVHIEHVAPPRLVIAQVTGDIAGRCRVELGEHPDGTEIRLSSQLTAVRGLVTLISRALPALAQWGHDWVLDAGARQFEDVLTRPTLTPDIG
jgi:hypothetical protein